MSDTHPSRRGFLAGAAATCAAASGLLGLPSGFGAAGGQASAAVFPRDWTRTGPGQLKRLVGQSFLLAREDGGRVALKLVDVLPLGADPHRPAHLGRREGMIAIFDGADDALVEAGHRTYRVGHARAGSTDVFLGPVRLRQGGYRLEAVFN